MQLNSFTNYLETIAPLSYQEPYDNSGLLIGDRSMRIKGVLISLDCTEEIIDEAAKKNCNLVISHHPLIFSGVKQLTGSNYVQRTIAKAIKKNIAVYAIHTNLDNIVTGVNAKICERLGLINCSILAPKESILSKLYTFCPLDHADKVRDALFRVGAGSIGDYDECSFSAEGTGTFRASNATTPYVGKKGVRHNETEQKIEMIFPSYKEHNIVDALIEAHPYEEVAYDIVSLQNKNPLVGSGMIGELKTAMGELPFLKMVKRTMKTGLIRHTELLGKKVKKVAVCGGAGSFLLPNAIGKGADVFITSDYKYHQFFDAEDKLVIADIGHYESEQFTKELLYDIVKKKFTKFALHLSEINTNPVKYL